MPKTTMFFGLAVIGLLFFGCAGAPSQPPVQPPIITYACPDGTVVTNLTDCQSHVNAPNRTSTPTAPENASVAADRETPPTQAQTPAAEPATPEVTQPTQETSTESAECGLDQSGNQTCGSEEQLLNQSPALAEPAGWILPAPVSANTSCGNELCEKGEDFSNCKKDCPRFTDIYELHPGVIARYAVSYDADGNEYDGNGALMVVEGNSLLTALKTDRTEYDGIDLTKSIGFVWIYSRVDYSNQVTSHIMIYDKNTLECEAIYSESAAGRARSSCAVLSVNASGEGKIVTTPIGTLEADKYNVTLDNGWELTEWKLWGPLTTMTVKGVNISVPVKEQVRITSVKGDVAVTTAELASYEEVTPFSTAVYHGEVCLLQPESCARRSGDDGSDTESAQTPD